MFSHAVCFPSRAKANGDSDVIIANSSKAFKYTAYVTENGFS